MERESAAIPATATKGRERWGTRIGLILAMDGNVRDREILFLAIRALSPVRPPTAGLRRLAEAG